MKSGNVLTIFLSTLLIPIHVAAGPVALPPACVCVTDPCPCNGNDPTAYSIKERNVPPPPSSECTIGDTSCEIPLTRDWCLENRDECRMRLGFASGKRGEDAGEAVHVKRAPLPARPAADPLELCLKYWHLCTGGSDR